MTINIAVITSEALVIGCDSIASTTRYLIDPFSLSPKSSKTGKASIEFDYADLQQYVTGAWGNVSKMFPLQTNGACVAAVTCGLARLNDRTMSSYASEFLEKQHQRAPVRANVKAVANDFLKFISKEFMRHYEDSNVPEEFWDGPEFLIGGYGKEDQLPSLYRVKVREKTVDNEFKPGDYGVSWAGQSDAVVRLIHGYDGPLRVSVEEQVEQLINDIYDSTSSAVARILQEALDKLGVELPKGINTQLPPKQDINLSWNSAMLSFPCRSWPTQDAIDFAAFLVNMQSARAKFVPGVATVGGRTHIGVITKASGFEMLNEPELKHRNTGFCDDI